MLIKLANLILFNTAWFACVLGAAWGVPWFGPAVVAMIGLIHLAWRPFPGSRRGEALLIVSALTLGYLVDSLLVLGGVLVFPSPAAVGWPSAVWMVALWANLAMTLHVSMQWLSGRYFVAAIFGAIGGPLAYWGGERLGAVEIGVGTGAGLALIGAAWLAAMPALVWIADVTARCGDVLHDGHTGQDSPAAEVSA